MATKKKAKKKPVKPKKQTRKKLTPVKAAKPSKKVTKKKSTPKNVKKQSIKKTEVKKKAGSAKERTLKKTVRLDAPELSGRTAGLRPAKELSDFQGISRREGADSESVDELLEEGNSFEAGIVSGVERADDADEQEVHTREIPEDDVPDEYLDED